MKYAAFVTISDDFTEEQVKGVVLLVNKSQKLSNLKKGIRLSFSDLTVGIHGEDFIYARRTVRLRYVGYRIPRFLGRYLISKL